jgi:hypothetical protein
MKKELVDEHLIRILKKTTPYQRMVWLKKNLDFWKKIKKEKRNKNSDLLTRPSSKVELDKE